MIWWIENEVGYNLPTVLYLNRKKDLEMKGSHADHKKFLKKFDLTIDK